MYIFFVSSCVVFLLIHFKRYPTIICCINYIFCLRLTIDGPRMLVVLFFKIHRVHGHGNLHIFLTRIEKTS